MGLLGGKKKHKVLVAEDEENIRTIIKYTLESANFEVVEFNNGQGVLDALPKEDPDLILLDVMMPLKNGFEVCYEIKNNTKYGKIPVIILTAMTQSSTKSDDYWRTKSRADGFITKPFKSAELVRLAEELIGQAKNEDKGRFKI